MKFSHFSCILPKLSLASIVLASQSQKYQRSNQIKCKRMEESRKGASSTTDLRKKNNLLDEDIDDDFMKSWKSISVAKADAVDFSFGTVPKSKNKAFDFGALDVDFNLDGSFEKLSSFNLDMPDLDFSCPPKKAAKDRSSCKEESANENQQKQIDALNFSFDFKELDGFHVDSSLEDGERTCNQKLDTKAWSSSRVECEGSEIHIVKEDTAFDNNAKTLPASGNETISKVLAFRGDHCEVESEVADGTPHEAGSVEHTIQEDGRFEKSCLSENEVSKSNHQAIHDTSAPAEYIDRKNAFECNSAELQPEISTSSEVSCGSENVMIDMIDSDRTCCENLPLNNVSAINLPASENTHEERDNSGGSPLNEVVDNIQLAKDDLNVKDSSNTDVSRKLFLDIQESRENQNLKSKLPTVSLCRGHLINKVTFNENDGNSSKSRADVDRKPQPHQSSSIRMKNFSFGNNRIATGEGKLCRDSLPHNKVANLAPPVVSESEKNFGERGALSAKVNPSNTCVKTTTQTHCYSELLKVSTVPNRSSKIISAQETKLCSTKTGSKIPNLSSLKISRDFGGKQVQSIAGGDKERKSGDSEQNIEAGQRSKASDVGRCSENAEKRQLLVSNSKRKVLEAPSADLILLKPLKRLAVSPSVTRNYIELSEKKTEQVEGMPTNASHDQLAPNIGNPHVPNSMELETSLDLENNRNVEKAEAYSKELEDICNMLRKKHDEAKEILVRAIVNNNSLLMLNHPIHEEKIRKVQKFAAKLLSKELQTKAA